jgi:hypothetical protein
MNKDSSKYNSPRGKEDIYKDSGNGFEALKGSVKCLKQV